VARGSEARHRLEAVVELLLAHLGRRVPVAPGGVEQHEPADATGLGGREARRDQRPQRVTDEHEPVDAERIEERGEGLRVVSCGRRRARECRRATVARRVPCDHPEPRGQGLELMDPARRARSDAVQQDEGRVRTGFPIRDDACPRGDRPLGMARDQCFDGDWFRDVRHVTAA